MRSLVMGDVETGSEWAHLLGESMAGELKGKRLKPLLTDMVTWGQWKEMHPETTVLDMSRTARDFSKDFYRNKSQFVFGFIASGKPWAISMHQLSLATLKNFAVGEQRFLATYDSRGTSIHLFVPKAPAVEQDPASDQGDLWLTFDTVDNRTMRDRETGSTWLLTTGQAIDGKLKGTMLEQAVGIMSFLKAWKNFHPETQFVDFAPKK